MKLYSVRVLNVRLANVVCAVFVAFLKLIHCPRYKLNAHIQIQILSALTERKQYTETKEYSLVNGLLYAFT